MELDLKIMIKDNGMIKENDKEEAWMNLENF